MTGIDISEFVAAINRLRAELPPVNREGAQWSLTGPDATVWRSSAYDAGHAAAARDATSSLVNPHGRTQEIEPALVIARTGGVFDRSAT